MKKLLIIGTIALVVVGCVLAAGCTSNPTTDESVFGIWITDDGEKTVVLANDFRGAYIDGDNLTDVIWKITDDGKYTLMRGDEIQESVTIEKNKGILTNATGTVFTNVGTVLTNLLSGASAALTEEKEEKLEQIVDKLESIEAKLDDRKGELEEKLQDKINELASLKEDTEFNLEILQKAKEEVQKQRQEVEKKIR